MQKELKDIYVYQQLSIDTEEVLKSFKTTVEISEYLGIKNATKVSSCCTGKREHAYGYKWRKVVDNSQRVATCNCCGMIKYG